MLYVPSNWYWIVGDDEANVWSSHLAASIPVTDADYVAWLEAGKFPSRIPTMADLEAVLAEQYPPGSLNTYTAFRRWQTEQAGITLTSGMPIETDDRAQAKINGTMLAVMNSATAGMYPKPPSGGMNFSTQWHAADGTIWALDAAGVSAMSLELQTHLVACFSASAQCLQGIADGTVTTREQIDTTFDGILAAQK